MAGRVDLPGRRRATEDVWSMNLGQDQENVIFTIFEGTSEIQRMIIGRAVTRLDVR
jgi:alkylation response protein AidB-like acyl-CoA dehydrogenase